METPTPSPSSTRRTAILLVAVAFVAGALIGFAGGRVYSIYRLFNRGPRGDVIRDRILQHLDRELKLTPQQRDQIGAILDRHHKKMQEITEGIRPQMHQEIDGANREIEALLTPAQRSKYDAMRMHMERFIPGHGRRHDRPPAPAPPGV
jgi:Spy/CpxP family protein refolding chaperone